MHVETSRSEPRVREFIQSNFLYARPDYRPEDEDDLLGEGIIDSMGIMELIEFLEKEFSLSIPEEDLTEENLGTIGAITRYVTANGKPRGR
jgi:acyl carrier protein